MIKINTSPIIRLYFIVLFSRWFIESALTFIVSTVALFIIPDVLSSPAKWLTHEGHLLAQVRMEEDVHGLE